MEYELRQLREEEAKIARRGVQLGLQFIILAAVSMITAIVGIEMEKTATMWVAVLEMLITIPYGCVTVHKLRQLQKESKVLLSRIIELLEKESIE